LRVWLVKARLTPNMRKPVEIPKNSKPPACEASSVLYFRLGQKRYEIRTTVEAREVATEPAEVIEMANRDRKGRRVKRRGPRIIPL
jgi:hypothetical protein